MSSAPKAGPLQTPATEIHFSVPQVSVMWGWDRKTIVDIFRNEEGVISRKGEAREMLSIPHSVVNRVHEKLHPQAG